MTQATEGLTLIGLVGIVDPPRDEIPDVVRTLRRAGIRIFMVTGDFKLTAQAIAIECGIITNLPGNVHDVSFLSKETTNKEEEEEDTGSSNGSIEKDEDGISYEEGGLTRSIALSGPELTSLNDEQWDQLCQYNEIVFARTTPEQKLRIVKGMLLPCLSPGIVTNEILYRVSATLQHRRHDR